MQVILTIVVFCVALFGADLLFGDGQITQRVLQSVSDMLH
jgi:hypothetical protein